MADRLRPDPVTLADELVAAVHDRLVEQNELLRELLDRTPPRPVEVPVVEPAEPVLVMEPAPARRPRKRAGG
jgi:hypothetical protein